MKGRIKKILFLRYISHKGHFKLSMICVCWKLFIVLSFFDPDKPSQKLIIIIILIHFFFIKPPPIKSCLIEAKHPLGLSLIKRAAAWFLDILLWSAGWIQTWYLNILVTEQLLLSLARFPRWKKMPCQPRYRQRHQKAHRTSPGETTVTHLYLWNHSGKWNIGDHPDPPAQHC